MKTQHQHKTIAKTVGWINTSASTTIKRFGGCTALIHSTFILGLLLFAPLANADFRALLVGIDYQNRVAPDPIKPLCGALNDVDDVRTLMIEKLGIPENKIRVLREEQATHSGILQAFQEWLIDGSQAGDQLYFHYSGHGMLVPDNSETQAKDPTKQHDPNSQRFAEAFVPYDTHIDIPQKRVDRVIRDHDLHPLLQQLQDRDLTLFIDSCHSGGITKTASSENASVRRVELPWLNTMSGEISPMFGLRGLQRAEATSVNWNPAYRLFAAVRYDQYAREYPIQRCTDRNTQYFNGAMTYAILELLRKNPKAQYSNQDVFNHSRSYLKDTLKLGEAVQQPQFFGPQQAAGETFVLLNKRGIMPLPSETKPAALTENKPQIESPPFPKHKTKPTIRAEFWLDARNKTQFALNHKPILHYRIEAPAHIKTVWLSLINIAPDGSAALLYPPSSSFYNGAGTKVFLNAEVSTNIAHQIPDTRLAAGENVRVDAGIVLNQRGTERFKLLVSEAPIAWDKLDLGAFRRTVSAVQASDLLQRSSALAQQQGFWAEQELQIAVQ